LHEEPYMELEKRVKKAVRLDGNNNLKT